MHPKLLRAYLLGLITGMGAAVAYLAGLARYRKKHYRQSKAFWDAFEHLEER